jgi:hypothetical protein
LLIWPALLWSAWKGGLRWGWIVGIACVGTLFVAAYLWNLPSPAVSKSMDFSHVVRSLIICSDFWAFLGPMCTSWSGPARPARKSARTFFSIWNRTFRASPYTRRPRLCHGRPNDAMPVDDIETAYLCCRYDRETWRDPLPRPAHSIPFPAFLRSRVPSAIFI